MPRPCPTTDQLGDFVAGHLRAPDHDQIDAHLDDCEQCQTEVDRMGSDTLLDSLPLSAPPLDGELSVLMQRAKQLGSQQGSQLGAAGAGNQNATRGSRALLQSGDCLGEYEIIRPIGAGGMGQVYLATHRRMQRQVAVKLLSPQWSQTDQAKDRFQRETEAVAKLNHPSIVTAYDAGEVDGQRFLVMEYIDGETMQARVRRGPLPPSEVADVGRQAAEGLLAAHDAGLIHRDVKPSNLICDSRGRVKVLDLGLARPLPDGPLPATDLTDSQHCMGTADYMAPEQAVNPKQAGESADVYSLGCTLFHLLEGRKPFSGEAPIEVILAHREQPVPMATRGESTLRLLIREMMAKDAEDRPTMAQVRDRVAQFPRTTTESEALAGSSKHVALILIAATLLVAVPVAMWLSGNHQGETTTTSPLGITQQSHVSATAAPTEAPPLELVNLNPGSFQMGSATGHPQAKVDEQPHAVELTRPFALGKFEVTVKQWRTVMGEEPTFVGVDSEPPEFQVAATRDRLPVQGVQWLEAVEFCNALSKKSGIAPFYEIDGAQVRILGGDGYRLPTEAEWEFACRAGTSTDWHFGDDQTQLDDFAWHSGNTKHRQLVGQKPANAWGLHDLHGNVAEWCWDRYDPQFYPKSPAFDPVGSGKGNSRVFRGGAWYDRAPQTRSAARGAMQMTYGRYQPVGLRVARNR